VALVAARAARGKRIEDAFLEWSQRDRRSFEDFAATTLRRPGFEPWHLRIVVDRHDDVVGACFLVTSDTDGRIGSSAATSAK
jgi:mycothiol synthase